MRILLDLDGVLVDFVGGACKAHSLQDPFDEPLASEVAGVFWLDKIWEMDLNEFWEPMKDSAFWEELDWMPDGREILEICEQAVGRDNVCLLTSPSRGSGPVVGKINWIEKNLSEYKHRNLIGTPKEFCASPDSILVDDSNRNIEDFVAACGNTILVPRPWNLNWENRGQAAKWVKWSLEVLNDHCN